MADDRFFHRILVVLFTQQCWLAGEVRLLGQSRRDDQPLAVCESYRTAVGLEQARVTDTGEVSRQDMLKMRREAGGWRPEAGGMS